MSGLIDFSPKQPQHHDPKKSPDHAADGDQGQETNEQADLSRSSFASVSVFGDVPKLIDRQSQKDEKAFRDTFNPSNLA
jgi:hypothetical protein